MSTRNFVVKNGLTVGIVTIDAATGNLVAGNANLGNLAVANFFSGDGSRLSNINGANITGNISGNISNANYATFAGNVVNSSQPNITSVGTLTALSVTGNVSAGGLLTDNLYYANGTPWDLQEAAGSNNQVQFNTNNNFAASANFTFNPSTNLLTVTGNIAGSNVNAGNLLTANYVAGTLTTAAQPNVTSVGTLTSLSVTGNASAGNVNGGNLVTANYVAGTLTTAAQPNVTSLGTLSSLDVTGNIVSSANVVTDLIVGKTSSVTITATGTNQNINLVPTGTGAVNVGNFIISNVQTPVSDFDAATKKYVDDVAQGLNVHDAALAATTNTLATLTGGTITYNNGTAGVGATLTLSGSPTKNFTAANTFDGNVTAIVTSRILVKSETNAAYNGVYVVTSSTVLTRAADYNTVPEVEAGDFIFVQDGDTYNDSGWVQTSSVTTIGTDPIEFTQFSGAGTYTAGTGLSLNGTVFSIANTTVTAGSYGNGDSVATFTVNNQGQLSAAANVAITANAANLTGTTLNSTIVNSSLTSVGTLGSLAVTANVTAGNVYANSGTIGASSLAGTLTTAAQPNITSVGTLTALSVTGNVSAGNVSGTTLTGSLATAAQPNITSVGTLTSLAVTGNASAGNISTAGVITANGNITANYFIGNGSQLTGIDATAIQNGSANVRTFANANVAISASGNANIVVVTGEGANIAGYLTVTGNVSGNVFTGNGSGLSAIAGANVTGTVANATFATSAGSATTAGTVTTAAQPNITSVGTLSSLSVTGNASAGNFTGANLVSANFVAGTLTTAAQPNITSVGQLTSLDVSGNIDATYTRTIGYSTDRANVSVSSGTVIDQFSPSDFRTAKYVISASGDNGYQSVETLLVHDGVDAYITIYGSVCSNVSADIIDVSANINGVSGNVALYATAGGANVIVNVVASYINT